MKKEGTKGSSPFPPPSVFLSPLSRGNESGSMVVRTNNGSKRFAAIHLSRSAVSKNRTTPKVWTNPRAGRGIRPSSNKLRVYPAAFDNYLASEIRNL